LTIPDRRLRLRCLTLWIAVCLPLLAGSALTGAATAQSLIERMVSPGALSNAHAKLEATCTNCHRAFSRQAQSALCLSCHKDVAADAATQSHFHGRSLEVRGSQCRRCHVEHRGREASIVFGTPELFDHRATDFPLTGAHIGVACGRCHAAKAAFRSAAKDCHACHAAVDPHQGQLGPDCAKCHVTGRWTLIAPWPHLLWPLVGAHREAACRSCHAGPRFVGLPTTCVGCHRQDDVHRGKLGPKCASCHSPVAWEQRRRKPVRH
jgi:Cytochrome c3